MFFFFNFFIPTNWKSPPFLHFHSYLHSNCMYFLFSMCVVRLLGLYGLHFYLFIIYFLLLGFVLMDCMIWFVVMVVDDLFEMLRDFSFSFPMLYYSNENAYFRWSIWYFVSTFPLIWAVDWFSLMICTMFFLIVLVHIVYKLSSFCNQFGY